MKSIFVIVTLLFSGLICRAQIVRIDTVKNSYHYKSSKKKINLQSDYLYSLGIRIYSVEQFPKLLNATDPEKYYTSGFNGFMFKFNDNQISYRFGGSFYDKNVSFENECKDCEEAAGRIKDLNIKVGFEKNITHSVIQPYFGADLGFRRNTFEGQSTGGTTPYDVNAEKNSAVFGPVAGIKLNLISHLTVGLESGIDLIYSYERQEKAYRDAARTQTFNKYTKFEFLTRPLSAFSVQYNFGLSN